MSSLNDGLLLHLPLNEIQGENTVFDDSGNQWNGKAYNTQIVDDDIFGRCLKFAGSDASYVELSPLQATVDFSQGFTVEAWVRLTGEGGAILELGDASGQSTIVFHLSFVSGLFLETYAGGKLQSSFLTTDESQMKGSPLEGEWLHIAVSISPDIDPKLLDTPSASMDRQQKQERANVIVQYATSAKIVDRIKFYVNGEARLLYQSDPDDPNEEESISSPRRKYQTGLDNFVADVNNWKNGADWTPPKIPPLLFPLNLSQVECKRNFLGKSSLSVGVLPHEPITSLNGRLAQLRVYTRSLSQDEIQWDMQEDNRAKKQFRTTYPIDFRLENADTQPVLLLDSNPNGQDMTLSIRNMARAPIQVVEKSGAASPDNFHFALQFRPGTLTQSSRIALAPASLDGWSLTAQVGQAGQGDCLYLLRTKPLTMVVGFEVALVFQHMMPDGAAGTRGTRVLLRYNQLQMAAGEPISGTREQYLDIVLAHGSQPQIPFSYNSETKEITVQGSLKSPQDGQPLQVISSLEVTKDLIVNGTKLDVKSIPKIKTDSNFNDDQDAIPTVGAILKFLQSHMPTQLLLPRTVDLGSGVSLEMVPIPGGTFMMGSDENPDEMPIRSITVPPFYMSKYPVTQAQWRVVAAKLGAINIYLEPNLGKFQGDDLPAMYISWYEAEEFCNRLSKFTNDSYRLPSEAEWEYACRAGSTTRFYFGNNDKDLKNYGWYEDNSLEGPTNPVGQLEPNRWGLYDMHGNVYEWCKDTFWGFGYDDVRAPTDGSAWILKEESNPARIARGGCWYSLSIECRSASRIGVPPETRDLFFGFRVVCSAPKAR